MPMDVILDTNIYESDIRMEGIGFLSLFDYLRKAKAHLVLPRSIREEAIASYKRRLKRDSKVVDKAWESYRYLMLSENVTQFRRPDIEYEGRRLRRRFQELKSRVKIKYVATLEGVSADEVFLRGVHRKAPANAKGEELRDVMIWLFALHYAKHAATEVAFVSADSGFWDGDSPHDQIKRDIAEHQISLRVYKTIEDFVKHNSPEPTPIDASWTGTSAFVDTFGSTFVSQVGKVLLKHNRLRWSLAGRQVSVLGGEIMEVKFLSGERYNVAPNSSYAELNYRVKLRLEIRSETRPPEVLGAALLSKSSAFYGGTLTTPFGNTGTLADLRNPSFDVSITHEEYFVTAGAKMSLRLEDDQISETELHQVEIEELSRAESVEPKPEPS